MERNREVTIPQSHSRKHIGNCRVYFRIIATIRLKVPSLAEKQGKVVVIGDFTN